MKELIIHNSKILGDGRSSCCRPGLLLLIQLLSGIYGPIIFILRFLEQTELPYSVTESGSASLIVSIVIIVAFKKSFYQCFHQ